MSLEPERLLATPDHHFLTFDGNSALFLPMDRASYLRSAFLDGRAQADSQTPIRLPLEPLLDAARKAKSPQIGWIFHVARCGSTLLSRLIDSADSSLVLREPPPLRQMGLSAAAGVKSREWRDRLQLASAMAARRFNAGLPTIVKANVPVNFILEELLELEPTAPSILLYQPLEPYLVSILRAPQHRIWVERITDQLAPALTAQTNLAPGSGLPERAAALWLYQMLAFDRLLKAGFASRTLNAETLFEAPIEASKAVARHLGAVGADVDGNAARLLGRYAKDTSRQFSDEDRRKRDRDDRRRLEEEISQAHNWLEQNASASNLPERLGSPLVGESPLLVD